MFNSPINQPPLYEEDQVITLNDLEKIINDLSEARIAETPIEEQSVRAILATLKTLHTWVATGKSELEGF